MKVKYYFTIKLKIISLPEAGDTVVDVSGGGGCRSDDVDHLAISHTEH